MGMDKREKSISAAAQVNKVNFYSGMHRKLFQSEVSKVGKNTYVGKTPWNVWVYDFAAYERLATKDTQINGWKFSAEHSKF